LRLSLRARLALVAGFAAAVGVLAVAPRPFSAPIRKLANYRSDPPGPIFNVPIDEQAIARAAAIMPRDSVYALVDGAPPSPGNPQTLLHHDLLGATYIQLLPAVPAVRLRDASWAIVYKQPIPAGPVEARYPLGPRITLLKLGGR
jgi:hypothetical protein